MKALTSGVNFCRCEKVKLTDEYSKVMYFLSVTEKPRVEFASNRVKSSFGYF